MVNQPALVFLDVMILGSKKKSSFFLCVNSSCGLGWSLLFCHLFFLMAGFFRV